MKITTLCFGNINRSPAAKYAIEKAVQTHGLDIVVDSCGTSNYNEGKRASKRMRDEMGSRGYDLTDHVAKQITPELIAESDIIVYMDTTNYNKITKMFTPDVLGNRLVKLSKYCDFDNIEDPHFASAETAAAMYKEVVDQIIEASEKLVQQIKNNVDVRDHDVRTTDLFGW